MLIVLPPSESKRRPPPGGRPVDLDSLSFPALTPMRERVLDAVIETSRRPDAFRRLQVGPSLAAEVARNTWLREAPTCPVLDVYAGALHEALGASTLSRDAHRRAASGLLVVSALWGALRPADRIPAYRLDVCSRLVGMDRLEPSWRTVLPGVLADAAGSSGVVADCRSHAYQAVGMATGLADRTVVVRVVKDLGGTGLIGDVPAKRTRGELARHLLESGADPQSPDELATVASEQAPVELVSPGRPGQAWRLDVALRG
jgi:cytoplasmic iron level regulating protein YaaA (DUF328/UPF0246 family)